MKRVELGSQDVLLTKGAAFNAAELGDQLGKIPGTVGQKDQDAFDALDHCSDSSGSNSPVDYSPPQSPTKHKTHNPTPPQPKIGYHNDLLLLRSKLTVLSRQHYESFWADNGPMYKALHNQFRSKELIENLPSDLISSHYPFIDESSEKMEEFRNGKIDDFALFNCAYGLNNSFNNSVNAVDSGYQLYNQIIEASCNSLLNSSNLFENQYAEFHRRNALFRLTNELTTYNKTLFRESEAQHLPSFPKDWNFPPSDHGDTFDSYHSVADLYIVLENIISPLTILKTHLNYQGIINSVSTLHEQSHDQIYQYLLFSSHYKRAQILNIIKPLVDMSCSLKRLSPAKQTLRKHIEQFAKGQINETAFKASLNKLSADHNWKQLDDKILEINNVQDNQQLLAAFLEINVPEDGLSYESFISKVAEKSNNNTDLPLYKKELAKHVTCFAKGELSFVQFQGQLKILSLNFRPNSFWARLGNYLGAIFTLNFSRVGTLWQQYGDINHINKVIRHSYKETASNRDSQIATLSVSNDVLPVKETDIRNQDATKATAILWLNEQQKERCESISRACVPALTPDTKNTNPHYASALSKLHFIASQKSSLERETRKLSEQVTTTINENQQIKSSPTKTQNGSTRSQQIQKSLVSAITLGLGVQRKAQVYSYVAETLAHEPKTLSAVG
ncbi:MAG: hypothetical protein K2X50_05710 [Gammaproteobacteria bacterium]|nr:hypothetical protein [Gammaproteobacteria bacterium]